MHVCAHYVRYVHYTEMRVSASYVELCKEYHAIFEIYGYGLVCMCESFKYGGWRPARVER